MKKPEFSEMTAMEYIELYGVKNAIANFTPYLKGNLLFIIPSDLLPETKKILTSMGFQV